MASVGASAGPVQWLPLHTADINNDGVRDVADILCYVQVALNSAQGYPSPYCVAFPLSDVDMHCDGTVNQTDFSRAILVVLWVLAGTPEIEALLRIKDPDLDLIHDNCDDDDDGDDYPDECELQHGTDPLDLLSFPSHPDVCQSLAP
jgi:hypothetical protein